MSEGFDLGAYLKEAGVKIDTRAQGQQVEMIDIGVIDDDPNNFYKLSDLDDLASSILLMGQQAPCVVRKHPSEPGRYMILSGHRRRAARQKLIDEGHEEMRKVPCLVTSGNDDPDLMQLQLILANSTARKITGAELMQQAEQVEQLLYNLQEKGFQFPGRMRDHVAQACKVSTGKIARLKVIEKGLHKNLKKFWKGGTMNDSVAYALAQLDDDLQIKIWHSKYLEEYKSEGRVKDMGGWIQTIREIKCDKVCGLCRNRLNMQDKALRTSSYHQSSCAIYKCCFKCPDLERCGYSCYLAADEKREKRAATKASNDAAKETNRIWLEDRTAFVLKFFSRYMQLRADHGLADYAAFKKAFPACQYSDTTAASYGLGKNIDQRTELPLGWGANPGYFQELVKLADLLGCSVDYLLGRDVPVNWPQEADCHGLRWNTGFPDENGRYICLVHESGIGMSVYDLKFEGGGWRGLMMSDGDYVAGWMPMPKEEPK